MTGARGSRALASLLAIAVALSASRAEAAPAEANASAPDSETPARTEHPEGHGLVVAGVAITIGGVAAYAMLGAGLAIGNRAEQDLTSLTGSDHIARRRELLARGRVGNRVAIAGGIAAAVTLAVGIPLIVIGRRRATGHARSGGPRVTLGMQGAGAFLRVRI